MEAEVVLREVAAAAADFIDLASAASVLLELSSDASFARPMPVRFDFVPSNFTLIQLLPEVGSQRSSCGEAVDGVDDDVDVAVVVEVSEGAAAASGGRGDAGAALRGDLFEPSVAQVAVEVLVLGIWGFDVQLFDLGIDVAVAEQNVGPAVVVHVEEAAAPAEILRVTCQVRR